MVCSSLLVPSFQCLPLLALAVFIYRLHNNDHSPATRYRAPFYQAFCYNPPKIFTSKPTCWLYSLCSTTPLEIQGLFLGGLGKELRKGSLSPAHSVSLIRALMCPRKLFVYPPIKKVEITGLVYIYEKLRSKKNYIITP